jgi:hypothetical protein
LTSQNSYKSLAEDSHSARLFDIYGDKLYMTAPQPLDIIVDKIIAELIQAHRARNTSNPYEIRGFEVFLHRIGETCIQVMDKDGDFCGFLLRGVQDRKRPVCTVQVFVKAPFAGCAKWA